MHTIWKQLYFSSACALVVSISASLSAIADQGDALADNEPDQTVKQQLEAQQAKRAKAIKPEDNFFRHMLVYMRPPEIRDEAYLKEARELGFDGPADQLPYYRHWHTFLYSELDETAAIREQHELLLSGQAKPVLIPEVMRWLDENRPAMDALRKSTRCPHLYAPIDTQQPLFVSYRMSHYLSIELYNIMESFRASSLYHLSVGEVDAAVADCLAMDRLAKLMFQLNSNNVIEDAPRETRDNSKVLMNLLNSGLLTPEHLSSLAKQWAVPAEGTSTAQVYDKVERLLLIDYFERLDAGTLEQPSLLFDQVFSMGGPVTDDERTRWDWMVGYELLDTDLAIDHINLGYDELVDVLTRHTDFAEASNLLKQTDKTMRRRMRSMRFMFQVQEEDSVPVGMTSKKYTEQIIDGMLVALMHPNRVLVGPVDAAQYQTRLTFDRTMLAISRFQRATGSLPNKLDELVPKYLPALPMDPYDAAVQIGYTVSIHGQSRIATLSSVGEDRHNDEDDRSAELVIK